METKKKTSNKFSPEVRARAVRMVQEHRGDHASQWAAIASIAAKIGCTGETLRNWVRHAERDAGARPGATTDERERIKALERSRSALLCANRRVRYRGVTQTKWPPANPGRFKASSLWTLVSIASCAIRT